VQKDKRDLLRTLRSLEGKGYKAYKVIKGCYNFGDYLISVDHVQGDPFAAPSKLRVIISNEKALFPEYLRKNSVRQVALEDFILRAFERGIKSCRTSIKGTGHSGLIRIQPLGQEALKRSGAFARDKEIELRFETGFPAYGRRIAGHEACILFDRAIPEIVAGSLYYRSHDSTEIKRWVETIEDEEAIRNSLSEKKLVSFIADGAILPRASGANDRPLSGKENNVISFKSPESLRVKIKTPNSGEISGMGIREGVTLIAGGGYHGKSTLLKAICRSVYNHIPGDGREYVATRDDAVMIRSEDGRSVSRVCISPFISNLPYGKDTDSFTSQDSSGSTSEAANIIEALEMGSKFLLMDEDTSANNFLIRDGRMQRLVAKDKEPIVPFIDRVKRLFKDKGVSTVMVLGGSGDYFEVADSVIVMDEYIPREVTEEAKNIVRECDSKRDFAGAEGGVEFISRAPLPESFNPFRGHRVKIDVRENEIIYGRDRIDLRYVEQLVDTGQLKFIGDFIYYLSEKHMDGKITIKELIENGLREIDERGFDIIAPFRGDFPGTYTLPRSFEIAATINRLRTLRIK